MHHAKKKNTTTTTHKKGGRRKELLAWVKVLLLLSLPAYTREYRFLEPVVVFIKTLSWWRIIVLVVRFLTLVRRMGILYGFSTVFTFKEKSSLEDPMHLSL